MKKNWRLIVAVAVLLAAMLTAGIVSAREKQKAREALQEPPAAAVTAVPENISEEAAEETPEPEPVVELFTKDDIKTLCSQAEDAAKCCRDVYAAADKGGAANVVISEESVAQMVQALGDNGYPAIDYFGNLSMQCSEGIAEFGRLANLGSDAECCYYTVYNDGRIDACNIRCRGGFASALIICMEWNGKDEPEVYLTVQHSLSSVRYTDKGWLICRKGGGESGGNYSAYISVRVAPYDPVKLRYAERFIKSVTYAENNLFTTTWTSGDFGTLDFNCLYPLLHRLYYGSEPLTGDNAMALAGFKNVSGTDMHIVPYEQFEKVIQHYFDISTDNLRRRADNSEEYGGYFILGTSSKFYGTVPDYPEPEIVDYVQNPDGSLTFTVDAVDPKYGADRAFTHQLTVKDTDDGYIYVSNQMLLTEDDVLPAMVLQSNRKIQIALLGK